MRTVLHSSDVIALVVYTLSRMETRAAKIEEDLAEGKEMLKSLFMKMEKSEEEE